MGWEGIIMCVSANMNGWIGSKAVVAGNGNLLRFQRRLVSAGGWKIRVSRVSEGIEKEKESCAFEGDFVLV